MSPLTIDDQFAYPHVAGRRFEKSNFSNTPVGHPTTQFEDFYHVNADAIDETKIVTTKFVSGFCHGQLRFCLLVRFGPYFANFGSMRICFMTNNHFHFVPE